MPFAIKTLGYINLLHSKVSTISGHIKHLEGHLLSISSWSISNMSCSSCWNISSNIKSIFSKMAAAPSSHASQQMDITENEEQQIIEEHPQPQASEIDVPSSPEKAPASSLADLKPAISTIKDEKTAKIHLIDAIIYDTLSSDASYHTPPSEVIRKIYDSFPGANHRDLHRVSGKPKDHASRILVHLKLEPSSLISSSTLMGFSRPSHPDQELENIMKHMPNVSQYSRTSCFFQGPPSSFINEVTASERVAKYHLLDYNSISGPNFLSITSAINLLGNVDIAGKAERFIRAFHPAYINLIKGIKRQAQSSGDQQQTCNNHRAASSMTTSINKDGSIHINVKYD